MTPNLAVQRKIEFATAPPARTCTLVFDSGSALSIFTSTLRLVYSVEGI